MDGDDSNGQSQSSKGPTSSDSAKGRLIEPAVEAIDENTTTDATIEPATSVTTDKSSRQAAIKERLRAASERAQELDKMLGGQRTTGTSRSATAAAALANMKGELEAVTKRAEVAEEALKFLRHEREEELAALKALATSLCHPVHLSRLKKQTSQHPSAGSEDGDHLDAFWEEDEEELDLSLPGTANISSQQPSSSLFGNTLNKVVSYGPSLIELLNKLLCDIKTPLVSHGSHSAVARHRKLAEGPSTSALPKSSKSSTATISPIVIANFGQQTTEAYETKDVEPLKFSEMPIDDTPEKAQSPNDGTPPLLPVPHFKSPREFSGSKHHQITMKYLTLLQQESLTSKRILDDVSKFSAALRNENKRCVMENLRIAKAAMATVTNASNTEHSRAITKGVMSEPLSFLKKKDVPVPSQSNQGSEEKTDKRKDALNTTPSSVEQLKNASASEQPRSETWLQKAFKLADSTAGSKASLTAMSQPSTDSADNVFKNLKDHNDEMKPILQRLFKQVDFISGMKSEHTSKNKQDTALAAEALLSGKVKKNLKPYSSVFITNQRIIAANR
jgi:nucleotide-binding universal stress UspA family protein